MITVSGNLYEISGSASTTSFVRFWLRGTGGNQPFVSGTALLAPDGGNTWYADFFPSGSGAVTGSLYSTSQVTVGGVTGAIYYGMQVFQNGFGGPESPVSASGNININSPNILTVLPVVAAPTGDSTYLRLDGTNSPVTGQIDILGVNNVLDSEQYGSIDAAVAVLGTVGTVNIPSDYVGSESSNLVTATATGYKYYNGPSRLTIVDERGSNDLTINYPIKKGGKCFAQYARLGVTQNSSSPDDSSAGTVGANVIHGTMPSNGGTQIGAVGLAFVTGANFDNTNDCAVVGVEGYASYQPTGGAHVLSNRVYGVHGTANIDATAATGNITAAVGVHAGANVNQSSSGGTITASYGVEADEQTAGTTRNYSFHSKGSMLFENTKYIDAVDSGGSPRHIVRFTSGNIVEFQPLADANGFVFNNQAETSTFLGITNAGLTAAGKVITYNNIATAGNGLSSIYGATTQKSESAADTNVLTFTPPAAVGTYRINFTLSLSAANTATLGWTATWKDSNGNAASPTNIALFNSSGPGAAAPALTFTTSSAGNYYGSAIVDIDASATNIVVKLTFSGTSFAGKASATVERLI